MSAVDSVPQSVGDPVEASSTSASVDLPLKKSRIMVFYFFLLLGIVAETTATMALKESQGFTRWMPLCIVVVGYGLAIFCLGNAQRGLPIFLIASVWSGLGIMLVTTIAAIRYQQMPSLTSLGGVALIIIGVVIVNVTAAPPPTT